MLLNTKVKVIFRTNEKLFHFFNYIIDCIKEFLLDDLDSRLTLYNFREEFPNIPPEVDNELIEARKKYYELKSEKDKIFEKYENNPDEFASVEGFNKEYDAKKSNVLSGIRNRRVKKSIR